jgi:sigma-B regulation protein RsbU (phosphoserine phosphatase)
VTTDGNVTTYTILLVEDEPSIQMLFSFNLKKAGYKVELAVNGIEGLKKAGEVKPDLILSDIMMPVCDGLTFRKNLLENQELRKIPFVFLTARGEEDDILQAYELEIEDYIIKTASPKIISAKIAAIFKALEKERTKVVGEVQRAADSMGAKVVPEEFPVFGNFTIRHWHVPFKNVPGGDFIDYYPLGEDKIAIILGDVMGKRWNAWYFAVAYAGYVRSAIRFAMESSEDVQPGDIISKVNESVFRDERISEVFITLSIVILDKKNKTLRYSGAGDLPVIHKSAELKTHHVSGVLLGFASGSAYENIEVPLMPGDEIYMFTDGITEARNKEGKMLEEEGILEIIKSIKPDENQLEAIQKTFKEYTSNEFDDDLSLIAIRMN